MSSLRTKRSCLAGLWAALGYYAGKQADRSLLVEGTDTTVDVEIRGRIGPNQIRERIAGQLKVGYATAYASSSAPKTAELLALIFARMDERAKLAILDGLPTQFQTLNGNLPAADVDLVQAAEVLLKKLRAIKTSTRNGAVVFAPELAAREAAA